MALTGTNPTIEWPELLQIIDPDWEDVMYHVTTALDVGNIPAVLKAIVLLLEEDRDKVNWDQVTKPLTLIVDSLTYEGN